jgi:hypothetical protein
LDTESRLAKLGSLVNKESFSAALSLAPGAVAVAKTVSRLADDIIQTFIPAEEQEPVLQFTGDFNIATGDLLTGYYAILGSRDPNFPIPSPLPQLEVRDHRLFVRGQALSGLSYVVLEVRKTTARSRDLAGGTEWDNRLREAEDVAQSLIDDPMVDEAARQSAWAKCLALIKEAQTFLRVEPNFLRNESNQIVKAVYLRCRELVTDPVLERTVYKVGTSRDGIWSPDDRNDRALLGISPDDDLDRDTLSYAEQIVRSREILESP